MFSSVCKELLLLMTIYYIYIYMRMHMYAVNLIIKVNLNNLLIT